MSSCQVQWVVIDVSQPACGFVDFLLNQVDLDSLPKYLQAFECLMHAVELPVKRNVTLTHILVGSWFRYVVGNERQSCIMS